MLGLIPFLPLPIFDLGIAAIDAWTLCVALSFVLGVKLAARAAEKEGLDPTIVRSSAPWIIVGGFTGAHWVHVLLYDPRLLETPWSLLKIWSGLSSFGGFLGASLALAIHFHRRGVTFRTYGDALTLGFVPAWALARFGCFLAHDHVGRRSNFMLAVDFPDGARHDLGLYEAIWTLGWTVLAYALAARRPRPGTLAALTCIAYAVFRFPMDFLRATDIAGADRRYGGLTPAQYGAVGLLAFGVWMLVRSRNGGATSVEPGTSVEARTSTEAGRPAASPNPRE